MDLSKIASRSHLLALLVLATLVGWAGLPALAQTAGEGAIQGTVTDPSGAVVPNATVVATNSATGVATSRTTTSSGFYVISPLVPGSYSLTANAAGFSEFKQLNVTLNAMQTLGLNVTVKVGSAAANVTVTTAPPELQTTNATLGSTIDSKVYLDLPVLINNQQRDVTAFSNLLPGAQPGSRSSLFSALKAALKRFISTASPSPPSARSATTGRCSISFPPRPSTRSTWSPAALRPSTRAPEWSTTPPNQVAISTMAPRPILFVIPPLIPGDSRLSQLLKPKW